MRWKKNTLLHEIHFRIAPQRFAIFGVDNFGGNKGLEVGTASTANHETYLIVLSSLLCSLPAGLSASSLLAFYFTCNPPIKNWKAPGGNMVPNGPCAGQYGP
jgi:hypothetical protein